MLQKKKMLRADLIFTSHLPRFHYKNFYFLCLASACDKFTFHGIRFMLALYIINILKMGDASAYGIYGAMMAITSSCPFIGGWLTDKRLGILNISIIGAFLSFLGCFVFLLPYKSTFFVGLGLLVIGGGFQRANIPVVVGQLCNFHPDKEKKIFIIFFLAGSAGMVLSVFFCSIIGEIYGWNYGIFIATISSLIGLLSLTSYKFTGDNILEGITSKNSFFKKCVLESLFIILLVFLSINVIEHYYILNFLMPLSLIVCVVSLLFFLKKYNFIYKKEIITLSLTMVVHIIFYSLYEQGSISFLILIDRNMDFSSFSFFQPHINLIGNLNDKIPTTLFQAIDPGICCVIGAIWLIFTRTTQENIKNPLKEFGIGLLIVGASFFLLSNFSLSANAKITPPLIIFIYICLVSGELFIAPIGMAIVSKISPPLFKGFFMGSLFLSISTGQWIASLLSSLIAYKASTNNLKGIVSPFEAYMEVYSWLAFCGIFFGITLLGLEFYTKRKEKIN